MVRNIKARQTQAILALKGEIKWCLTGTPVQNRLEDMYSLLVFLGVQPFNDSTWWKALVAQPMRQGLPVAVERMKGLLTSICLRRLKTDEVFNLFSLAFSLSLSLSAHAQRERIK